MLFMPAMYGLNPVLLEQCVCRVAQNVETMSAEASSEFMECQWGKNACLLHWAGSECGTSVESLQWSDNKIDLSSQEMCKLDGPIDCSHACPVIGRAVIIM